MTVTRELTNSIEASPYSSNASNSPNTIGKKRGAPFASMNQIAPVQMTRNAASPSAAPRFRAGGK